MLSMVSDDAMVSDDDGLTEVSDGRSRVCNEDSSAES